MRKNRLTSPMIIIIVITLITIALVVPTYADGPDEIELSHEWDDAPTLGITGEFDQPGMGVAIPMSPDEYWFRFFVPERESFRFRLTQESGLATVRIVLELTDSTTDNQLAYERRQCNDMRRCSVTMNTGRLQPGYYFLKVWYTPPGVWDTDVPNALPARLTWDADGDRRRDARGWDTTPIRGFIDEDTNSHWYVIDDLLSGQDIVLTLWAEDDTDLDVVIYSDDDKLAEGTRSAYPELVRFTTTGAPLYFQIVNFSEDNAEYGLMLKAD